MAARVTRIQRGAQDCIRGMRVRVTDVLKMLARKLPEAEMLADFPNLESEDIQPRLFGVRY
ncbi:MAG: DUF433 domain-containing protein [Betaproteobacteria bacterium]|nr:DUF433 domain-containing protein [Betaproteobacteria bacterium]